MRSLISSLTIIALGAGAYAQAPALSPPVPHANIPAVSPPVPIQGSPPAAPPAIVPAGAPTQPFPRPPRRPLPTALTAEGLPDLSAQAASYPKGPDSDSQVLISQLPAGRYKVSITTNAHFPNRTLYLPTNVSPRTTIPILAWENGSCYVYGRMYEAFLSEIASHGYLVVAPGPPNSLIGQHTADWQTKSIALAKSWRRGAPFAIDADMVAVAGHSCGGGETMRNLAADPENIITTGIILNAAGGSPAAVLGKVTAPMLWVNGGKNDLNVEAAMDANLAWVKRNRPTLPVFEVGLQTGHLGSFWSPRGGIYAETVVRWLDWHLKEDWRAEAWFSGGEGAQDLESPAAQRGWKVQTNAID